LQPRVKGYSFALLATVAVSTVYIFSKAALNEVSLAQFGVYWFSMALLWNGLFAMRSKEHRQFRPIPAKSLKILLFLGVLEIFATGALYSAIAIGSFMGPFITSYSQYSALKYIEASRASFIQSTTALFVLLGAYLFFGKLPAGYQIVGGTFTIIGVLLLIVKDNSNKQ
jgi:drug/metabolite transporter (DMT)-like permease